MVSIRFPYQRRRQQTDSVLKPLVAVEFYSEMRDVWMRVTEMLADTGADYTTLPRRLGRVLVADIESGRPMLMRGVAAGAAPNHVAYLHVLTARLARVEFQMRVAIADSDVIPPILGRADALDRFSVTFQFGETIIIESA